MHVNVLLKNDTDRKRLFEAVKSTYIPYMIGAWNGRTYFEKGFYSNTYPCQAVMDTVNKTYCGVNDIRIYPMTVEEFIRTYIYKDSIGEL